MKHKLTILIIALILTALITPSPAYAYDNFNATLLDFYGDPWTWGGTVRLVNPIDLNDYCSSVPFSGSTVTIYCPPTEGGPPFDPYYGGQSFLWMVIDPAAGPQGDPGEIWVQVQAAHWPGIGDYNHPSPIFTGTGPNAIVLKDFSLTSSTAGPSWLPYILVVGSLALVSGALVLVRKKQK